MQRISRKTELSTRLDQLLTSYAMAATAAGVAMLACAVPANARVVCGHSSASIVGEGTIPFNPAKSQFAPFNVAQTYFGGVGTTWNRAFFAPTRKEQVTYWPPITFLGLWQRAR